MPTSFEKAIKETKDGIAIDLEVTPGSKKACFPAGYNQWRERIEIKLTSAAQKGKANVQLIKIVADFFNIGQRDVTIGSGSKSSKKTVIISGSYQEQVVLALESSLKK
ncbi:YggU family protein [Methanococcoides sp. SA1]|nr:YggU family protein [Methanococcoides sp. SA1]